jgi:twitching motility protein PilT
VAEIDRYLRHLAEHDGSDLHLSAGERPRMRVYGSIRAMFDQVHEPEDTRRLLFEILPPRNRAEIEETSDTDFSYELPGVARFRVNVFRDLRGIGAVFRLIPERIQSAEELGLPPAARRFCELPNGLVLVTGPTGSGKSTTLAAMIDVINRNREDHIITIEDPIEFVHPSRRCLVNQREVHSHTQSFARALRAALREDPDIVLLGEMRDLLTTRIAIETAETGHLVFGTLHTRTAASTIDRLISQFPTQEQQQIRMMVANSLRGIVAQVLLKRKPQGRVAAFEVLVVTPAVRNNIREAKLHQIPSLMQTGAKHGMVCLNDALLKLVASGLVDAAEALAKTEDPDDLGRKLRVAGIGERPGGSPADAAARSARPPRPTRTPAQPQPRSSRWGLRR